VTGEAVISKGATTLVDCHPLVKNKRIACGCSSGSIVRIYEPLLVSTSPHVPMIGCTYSWVVYRKNTANLEWLNSEFWVSIYRERPVTRSAQLFIMKLDVIR